jgi:hypothetical protein
MTLGAVAGSRRRTTVVIPANVITNGTFDSDTGWSGVDSNGKTISGGKANFAATTDFDPIFQSVTVVTGKYYELTLTMSNYSAGRAYPQLWSAGFANSVIGTPRSANGTYTERILINTGNNTFSFQTDTGPSTFSLDNVTFIGPYTTATVGGA